MKSPTVFHLIASIAKQEAIDCVLIGGFAVNYYNYSRQTADIDFLITDEDFLKIAPSLEKAGYQKETVEKIFARYSSNKFYLMDIDFLFVDKETLSKIVQDGQEMTIAGKKFIVPSLFNLIALKLHAIRHNPDVRETRDLPDIINLVKINGIDVRKKDFRDLCIKYGTKEHYEKLKKQCS